MRKLLPAILIGILSFATPCVAQCGRWLSSTFEAFPGFDRPPAAFTRWDPDGDGPQPSRLVVAGHFQKYVTTTLNRIGVLDGSTWIPLGDGFGDSVNAVAVYNGQLIAAGSFTTSGSRILRYVARWDGSQWQPLGTGMNGPVHALLVYKGELYVGGAFTTADDIPTGYLARWDGVAWRDVGGVLAGNKSYSAVNALAIYRDELIVAGNFTGVGATAIKSIGRWNGTSWSTLGAGVSNQVYAMAVVQDALYVGGELDKAGAASVSHAARWNGTTWSSFGNGLSSDVLSMAGFQGKLYVGGRFTTSSTPELTAIQRLDGLKWASVGGGLSGFSSITAAYELYADENALLAAGLFTTAGSKAANFVASWDGTAWSSFNSPSGGLDAAPVASTIYNGELLLGGSFSSAGTIRAGGIASWNGSMWRNFGQGFTHDYNETASVMAFASFRGELIAGGDFAYADGEPCRGVAAWDGLGWHALGGSIQSTGSVTAAVVFDGDLIVAGSFTAIGGQSIRAVARWDGISWRSMNYPFSNVPRDLAEYHGALIGAIDGGIVVYNGDVWTPMAPEGPGAISTRKLHVFNDQLFCAGQISFSEAENYPYLGAYSGVGWTQYGMGSNFGHDPLALALTTYRDDLVVGGDFASIASNSADNLGRWTGQEWSDVGGGVDGLVVHAGAFGPELVVGGTLNRLGSGPYNVSGQSWARWTDDGVPWISVQPQSTSFHPGQTLTLTVIPAAGYDFDGPLQFQWKRNGLTVADGPGGAAAGGGTVSVAISGTLEIANAQAADAGEYQCVVANSCGSAASWIAVASLPCPSDFDASGFVDTDDYDAFVHFFEAGGEEADFDQSGFVDFADFTAFVAAFEAGC